MDSSLLSDRSFIEISRRYICARLATYENREEGAFLETVFRGRTGELENTVFVILAPDGKTPLTRSGRSPGMALGRDTASVVKRLAAIAEKYPAKETEKIPPLPVAADLRLALNVAACDRQPLVVCIAKEDKTLARIEKAVARQAWSTRFLGQFHYAAATGKSDLAGIAEVSIAEGIIVVSPGQFGQSGTVLATHRIGDTTKSLADTLATGHRAYKPPVDDYRAHIRKGHQSDIFWKTLMPVTDPHSLQRNRRP